MFHEETWTSMHVSYMYINIVCLIGMKRELPDKAVRELVLEHSYVFTWYHLTNSSASGLLKNPPTSAPQNEMPATDSDRHMGIVIWR